MPLTFDKLGRTVRFRCRGLLLLRLTQQRQEPRGRLGNILQAADGFEAMRGPPNHITAVGAHIDASGDLALTALNLCGWHAVKQMMAAMGLMNSPRLEIIRP